MRLFAEIVLLSERKAIADEMAAKPASNRLANFFFILLPGSCLKSNAANKHLSALASNWFVITVRLSRLRLRREDRGTCQRPAACHIWNSLFMSHSLPGLPLNLSARSNGYEIFSQEKLIFFEQIQPLGVTRYPSVRLYRKRRLQPLPIVARHGCQRLEPLLTLMCTGGTPMSHPAKRPTINRRPSKSGQSVRPFLNAPTRMKREEYKYPWWLG